MNLEKQSFRFTDFDQKLFFVATFVQFQLPENFFGFMFHSESLIGRYKNMDQLNCLKKCGKVRGDGPILR